MTNLYESPPPKLTDMFIMIPSSSLRREMAYLTVLFLLLFLHRNSEHDNFYLSR